MVYFYGIFYNKKPYTEGSSFPQYDSSPHYHKLSDLMQCTGLKDKNDRLVYEGDILRQPDGIIDYVRCADGCYIHNGIAITNYDVVYQGDIWAKEVNTHEVIGNVYENPELLEV